MHLMQCTFLAVILKIAMAGYVNVQQHAYETLCKSELPLRNYVDRYDWMFMVKSNHEFD